MSNLAVFDFDGTITYKDTLFEFIKFYKGNIRHYFGLLVLSPSLVLFKLKMIPNWRAKEILLTYFFKGEPIETFQQKADSFAKIKVPKLLRPQALQRIKQHQQSGDRIIVISASAENWIMAWAKDISIELLATKLEVKEGKVTGKLASPNCHGQEKVNRLVHHLSGEQYANIYAYGDTKGDKQMLDFATYPHYRYF